MRSQAMHFKSRASGALADERLQLVLRRFGAGFAEKRAEARAAYGVEAFEELVRIHQQKSPYAFITGWCKFICFRTAMAAMPALPQMPYSNL